MCKTCLALFVILFVAQFFNSRAAAQDTHRISVQVKVGLAIRDEYKQTMQSPKLVEDELSEALANCIANSGKWLSFCWDVVAHDSSADAELQITLSKDDAANWVLSACMTAGSGHSQAVEQLKPEVIIYDTAYLTYKGHPTRKTLAQALSKICLNELLESKKRDKLHCFLRTNVVAGRGSMPAAGGEFGDLYLANALERFRFSIFRFVYDSNKIRNAVEVRGTGGAMAVPTGETKLSVLLPKNPPSVDPGATIVAYLVQYVRESEIEAFKN